MLKFLEIIHLRNPKDEDIVPKIGPVLINDSDMQSLRLCSGDDDFVVER